MRRLKRLLAAILIVPIFLTTIPVSAVEVEDVSGVDLDDDGNIASGSTDTLTWVIDSTGKLTVNGSGEIPRINDYPAWFDYRTQVKSAEINLTDITDASGFFYECSNLTSVDLSNLDTSNVTNMGCMFIDCSSLQTLDLSNFNTTSVTDMWSMFFDCSSLQTLDLSNFNTSNVTSMNSMFSNCSLLKTLNLGDKFDTSNVTSMGGMFFNCSLLKTLNFGDKFDTSNVTNMGDMFYGCSGLTTLDLSNFDTTSVTIMNGMFQGCSSLQTLDLSNFNTTSVTDMSYMFSGCNSLETLKTPYNCPDDLSIDVKSDTSIDGKYTYTLTDAGNTTTLTTTKSCTSWSNLYTDTTSIPVKGLDHSVIISRITNQSYTVTFKDYNDTILKTETVYEGKSATAPENPTREDYTFKEWDTDFTNVTSDLTVTATYTQNKKEDPKVTVNYVNTKGETLADSEVYTIDEDFESVDIYKSIDGYSETLYSISSNGDIINDLHIEQSFYPTRTVTLSKAVDNLQKTEYEVNLVYNYQATININYVSDIPWRVYMNSDGTYSFDYNILIHGASTVRARNNARVIDDWDLNSLASYSPRYVLTGDVDYNLADGVTISGVDTFKTSKSASDLTYSVEEPTKNTESTINVHITQDLSSFNVQYWDTDGNPIQPNSYYSTYDYNTNNYDSYTKQNIVAAIDDYVCTGYSYPYGDAVVTTIDDTTTDSDGNYTSIVVDIPEIVPGKSDTIRLTYKKVVKYHALKVYEKYEYADGTTEKTLTKVDTNVAEGASYEYTADCPEGYEIIGSDSYSGVVNEDTTLTFTYRKIPSYALKVYEEYQNSDGSSEKTVTVADTTVLRGYSYSYTANCPEGYSLVGSSSYSGTVSADTTLTFIYKKNKAATEPEEKPTETTKYTMKVYEKYEYADGTEEKTETLVDTTLDSGSSYEYIANCPDGYELVSNSKFSGVISSNTTLTFIYKKIKTYIITVKDVYYSVDGIEQKTDTRPTETKKAGETYSYSALSPVPEGYVITSDEIYTGTVKDDLTIAFTYYEDSARFVTVTGRLTYADGTPIANKRIEVHSTPRYTTTDNQGYYTVSNVEIGTHTFTVFANDDATDTTPLVTCELTVAKVVDDANEDKIEVTYKADNCEVNTDTNTLNVLKIDAIVPIYDITVVDEYYNGTTLESSSTRCKESYKLGETYTYNALSVSGYTISGVVRYSEACTEAKTLVFKYIKNTTSTGNDDKKPSGTEPSNNTPSDNTKPSDNTPSDTKPEETKPSDTTPEVTKPDETKPSDTEPSSEPSNDQPEDDKQITDEPAKKPNKDTPSNDSSVIVDDVITYKVKVIDNYYNNNLELQNSVVRVNNLVTEGTSYSYKALDVKGYTVSGDKTYTGVANTDVTLIFSYVEDAEIITYHTITVIDRYIIGEKLYKYNADFIKSLGDVTVSKTDEGYVVSTAHIIANDYDIDTEAVTRCVDTYADGTSYQYSSLDAVGWTLVGDTSYSGVVNSDLVLVFSYEKGFASVNDVPLSELPDLTAMTTFNSQPKTGSKPFRTVLPVVMFFATALASAFVLKKKHEDDK